MNKQATMLLKKRITFELSGARQLARLLPAKVDNIARSATDAARRPLQRFVIRLFHASLLETSRLMLTPDSAA